MSLDEEIRQAEPLGVRHLSLLLRAGRPHQCCFCGHNVLPMQRTCGHVTEYQLGDIVYFESAPVGRFVGDGVALIEPHMGSNLSSWVELPEAWKPRCACNHKHPVLETTMQAYQEKHGIDLRVAASLRHGEVVYHVRDRNADKSPLRGRVNGQIKRWKRTPNRFKLPMKHGFYGHFYLTQDNGRDWRTKEEWAR